jgi:hypothetical protein
VASRSTPNIQNVSNQGKIGSARCVNRLISRCVKAAIERVFDGKDNVSTYSEGTPLANRVEAVVGSGRATLPISLAKVANTISGMSPSAPIANA